MSTVATHSPVQLSDKIKLWSFILSLFGTIVLVCGAWVTVNTKTENNSTRIQIQEVQIDKMDRKLDRIIDKLDVIQLKVENKQDRK